MKKLTVFVFVCMVSTMLFAVPKSHECLLCYGTMRWTGETEIEWGKLTYEMKCPSGHVFWEVDENNSSRSQNYNGDGCQYDGLNMYYTWVTKNEWGKLLKQYKCLSGHVEWRIN